MPNVTGLMNQFSNTLVNAHYKLHLLYGLVVLMLKSNDLHRLAFTLDSAMCKIHTVRRQLRYNKSIIFKQVHVQAQ